MLASSKTITCRICDLADNTGKDIPSDLDNDIHYGFTIGKGKALYWMRRWHSSGHVTVYRADNKGQELIKRYLNGDTLVTIHFK